MKKLAICLPSYNESENIRNITKQIDIALCSINDNYDCIIVNCDNNSPDKTNDIFNSVHTSNKKISIVTKSVGKGVNIYNFLRFCQKNNIDYGITIDTDTKSFNSLWIINILKGLEQGYDFTCPLYVRNKEEGNTTNHFAVLVLYSIYGKFIRQPIGGDYGFNKRFINIVLNQKFTNDILKYGIDIFLVVTAIVFNLKIKEVLLGEKKHGLSYYKMDIIFEGVVKGFIDTYKQYQVRLEKEKIKYTPFVIKNNKWPYRECFDKIYSQYLKKYNFTDENYYLIEKEWLSKIQYFIENPLDIKKDFIEKLKYLFILRTVSFWDKVDLDNNEKWEQIIINNCLEIGG